MLYTLLIFWTLGLPVSNQLDSTIHWDGEISHPNLRHNPRPLDLDLEPHPIMAGLLPKIDRSKTIKSKDYRGSSSFATFLIVGRECLFFFSPPPARQRAGGD